MLACHWLAGYKLVPSTLGTFERELGKRNVMHTRFEKPNYSLRVQFNITCNFEAILYSIVPAVSRDG